MSLRSQLAPLALSLALASPATAAITSGPWSPEGGQAGAHFGASVAPAGDVNGDGFGDVLVGAPLFDNVQVDEGRVFLYYGSAAGLASSPAWTWEPNEDGAQAGAAVSPAGDINRDGYADFLVGAPYWDGGIGFDVGAVFVFLGSITGPAATPSDTLFIGIDESHFGAALSTAGDVNGDQYADVIIGAPDMSLTDIQEGGAFVYLGSLSGLGASPVFSLQGNFADAHLGASVSGAGDVNADSYADILVGAPGYPGSHLTYSGRAVVYRGTAAGIGTALATINGTADSMATGASVANAGDVNGDGYADIVVGSPGAVDGFMRNSGHANIYAGSAAGIVATPFLSINGFQEQERLGSHVATAGDVNGDGYADVLIDRERTPAPDVETGLVLVAMGGKNGVTLDFTLAGDEPGAGFAAALSASGDFNSDGYSEVLVGAPTYTGAGSFGQGAVFSWVGSASPPVPAGNTPISAAALGTDFGGALAILPLTETNLFPALLLGESLAGAGNVGRVEVRHAQWGSIQTFATRTFLGTEPNERFGYQVADAGDVNRDTWTDFIVSSPLFDGGGPPDRGKVTLYLGASTGPTVAPWSALGDQGNEYFGRVIAGRGDVNGDGYHDVLVAAPDWDSPTAVDCGKVWFYPGGPTGLGASTWSRAGTAAGERFGTSAALVGDLDADGYSDIAIGAESIPAGNARVEIWYGSASGPEAASGWTLRASPARNTFSRVAGAGDVDGDGAGDLVVGSPAEGLQRGMVFVYRGTRGRGQSQIPFWTFTGGDGDQTGFVVSGGGDLNGDGLADVVAGEPGFPGGQNEGRIAAFYGHRTAIQSRLPVPDFTLQSGVSNNGLGRALAPLSDVNADGFADMVAGAPNVTGRVFVAFGGGEGPPQFRSGSEPFAFALKRFAPGKLDNETLYGISQSLRSAAGRERLVSENEVQLQSTAFTGVPNRYANGYDSGAPGPLGSYISSSYYEPAPYQATTLRVRIRTRSLSPYFPRGRWMGLEGRASAEYDFRTGGTTTDAVVLLPDRARIERVVPNPARAAATIAFALPARATGRLDVYDLAGRHVRELARGEFPAGPSTRAWDGADDAGRRVAPGIYFVEFRAGGAIDRTRIVRLN
ncbi:MAG: FG-GAP-like repeat-containing protein [Candidatus Eisenbacteria bacterium]